MKNYKNKIRIILHILCVMTLGYGLAYSNFEIVEEQEYVRNSYNRLLEITKDLYEENDGVVQPEEQTIEQAKAELEVFQKNNMNNLINLKQNLIEKEKDISLKTKEKTEIKKVIQKINDIQELIEQYTTKYVSLKNNKDVQQIDSSIDNASPLDITSININSFEETSEENNDLDANNENDFETIQKNLNKNSDESIKKDIVKLELIDLDTNLQNIYNRNKNIEQQKYDLADTIRILYALEDAKKYANNFDRYIDIMAHQDYNIVMPDVVELQKQLIPILQELYQLQKEDKSWIKFNPLTYLREFSHLWEVVEDFEFNGVNIEVEGEIVKGNVDVHYKVDTYKITEVANKILDKYKKHQQDLKNIQQKYVEYIKKSIPIYRKYFKKWDYLCLYRDQAYISIYNDSDIDFAIEQLDKVLNENPKDRDALILKSYCLLRKSMPNKSKSNDSNKRTLENKNYNQNKGKFREEANRILDKYLELYPDGNLSAPALFLKGLYYELNNDIKKAKGNYSMSESRYPKQAENLLQFNVYKHRDELRKSFTGKSILKLYEATMLGFGGFSPNIRKALMYRENNEFGKANKEIYDHFFRRANQPVYDYMLEDINFCESYFKENFNKIFKVAEVTLEKPEGLFWKYANKVPLVDDRFLVKIKNNSDTQLKNVRVFLCLHLTDTYENEYEIIKIDNTINHIDANSPAEIGSVKINFEVMGKKKKSLEDVVDAMAIVLSDESILVTPKISF